MSGADGQYGTAAIVDDFLRTSREALMRSISTEDASWGVTHQADGGLSYRGRPDMRSVLDAMYRSDRCKAIVVRLAASQEWKDLPHKTFPFQDAEAALATVLNDCIDTSQRIDLSDALIRDAAQSFSVSLNAQRVGAKLVAPLVGLVGDVDGAECGDGWSIQHISEDIAARILTHFMSPYPDLNLLPISRFALVKNEELSIDDTGVRYAYEPAVSSAVKALRLIRPGAVTAPWMDALPLRPGFLKSRLGKGGQLEAHPQFAKELALSRDDVRLLPRVLDKLKTTLPPAVELALSRVASSSIRTSEEDRMIDEFIAVEALFSDRSDGLPGGISYKLAMRAAMFVFNQAGQRADAFKNLKAAQNVRSGVVHGSKKLELKRPSDADAVEFVSTFVRLAVRKVLLDLPSPDDFQPGYCDELIFRSLT